jgi:hypothetical protein
MKQILIALVFLSSLAIVTGCGENPPANVPGNSGNVPSFKPGGGGLPQPFNPGNGRYIPGK